MAGEGRAAAGRRRHAAPLLVLAVLLLAGCSPAPARGPSSTPASPMAPGGASTVGAAATTTPAAELRAGLTWQLVERTSLLAAARGVLLAEGDRAAPRLRDAEDLLDARAADLVRTVGGGAPLLAALDAEVDAVLAPRPDPAPLAAAHARTAAALRALAPALAADDVTAALDRSTARLTGRAPAADATAAEVAAGLVANAVAARDGLGSTETSAVVLRADLTRLLVERAHLAGSPPTSPALQDLTDRLAGRLAPGPAAAGVRTALRAGSAALAAAAAAAGARDAPRAARSRAALLAADRDLAARLAEAVPALPAPLVQRELDLLRPPLLAAAAGRGTGARDAPELAAAAAGRSVVTAALLASGVADQQRLR